MQGCSAEQSVVRRQVSCCCGGVNTVYQVDNTRKKQTQHFHLPDDAMMRLVFQQQRECMQAADTERCIYGTTSTRYLQSHAFMCSLCVRLEQGEILIPALCVRQCARYRVCTCTPPYSSINTCVPLVGKKLSPASTSPNSPCQHPSWALHYMGTSRAQYSPRILGPDNCTALLRAIIVNSTYGIHKNLCI